MQCFTVLITVTEYDGLSYCNISHVYGPDGVDRHIVTYLSLLVLTEYDGLPYCNIFLVDGLSLNTCVIRMSFCAFYVTGN